MVLAPCVKLGDLADPEFLRLADNDLSGPIPPEWGDLQRLGYAAIGNATPGGRLPMELSDLRLSVPPAPYGSLFPARRGASGAAVPGYSATRGMRGVRPWQSVDNGHGHPGVPTTPRRCNRAVFHGRAPRAARCRAGKAQPGRNSRAVRPRSNAGRSLGVTKCIL